MNMCVWKWLHEETLKKAADYLMKLLNFGEGRDCDDVVLVGELAHSFFLVEY